MASAVVRVGAAGGTSPTAVSTAATRGGGRGRLSYGGGVALLALGGFGGRLFLRHCRPGGGHDDGLSCCGSFPPLRSRKNLGLKIMESVSANRCSDYPPERAAAAGAARSVQHNRHPRLLSAVLQPPAQDPGHWVAALAINAVLIALAQRVPVLTAAGWVHAGILGTVLWGSLGPAGWLAVVAYLAMGSAVTKLGFRRKQARGLAEGRGGRRGPENVWGSALTGAVLALLTPLVPPPWRPVLLLGFAASFAAKLADTCGSEIGKRWGRHTVLITSLRPVPARHRGGHQPGGHRRQPGRQRPDGRW